LNLIQKLAAIRREVEGVDKKGKNTFQNYKYVMASDIAAVIGTKLAERNIMIARRNLKVQHIPPGEGQKNTIVLMECEYGFIDGDCTEFSQASLDRMISELWMPAWGEGRDTGDKAGYKAFTGMLKYFLLQAFLLATGDDPEADSPSEDSKPSKGKVTVVPDKPPEPPKPATADQIKELLQLCEDTQTEPDKVPTAFNDSWDTLTVQTYEKAKAILLKRVQKRAEHAANS
jgi:hypothetical protein